MTASIEAPVGAIASTSDQGSAAPPRRGAYALCPDCGRSFKARGLATHRRQAHGAHVRTARAEAVPGSEVSALLSELLEAVRRIEARTARIEVAVEARLCEASLPAAAGLPGTPTPSAPLMGRSGRSLEAELSEVLREIGVLTEALADSDSHELRRHLGRLRQQQAGILFRMGGAAPGGSFPDGDNELLHSLEPV
ncbi:MAG: hypothetical protein R3F49_00380 [Planctomycetota bacterium]